MKRLIKLAVFCFSVFTIVACGGGNKNSDEDNYKSDESKNNNENASYITACSNGDFDTAREYVEKMKSEKASAESIKEAEDYILNEEIQYLAMLNTEQATNRLLLLVNSQSAEGMEYPEGNCLGKSVYDFQIKNPDGGYMASTPDAIKSFFH